MNENISFPKLFIDKLYREQISALSIKIVLYLADNIGFIDYKKLPSRALLSRIFNVSTAAINKSLRQLEDSKLLVRNPEDCLEGNAKLFSGTFRISSQYDDMNEEELKEYFKNNIDLVLGKLDKEDIIKIIKER